MTFSHPVLLLLLLLLPVLVRLYTRGRKTVLWVRLAVFVLLVLAAAGLEVRMGSSGTSVAFLLDRSQSLGERGTVAGLDAVRRAVEDMGEDDRAGLVVFGTEALVERPLEDRPRIGEVRSFPGAGATDVAGAIRLGLGMLSGRPHAGLVLVSDGNQTVGDALREASFAAAQGVRIDVLPVGERRGAGDVALTSLSAPERVAIGEPFEVDATVDGKGGTEVTLRLYGERSPTERREVLPRDGLHRFRFPLRFETGGLHTLTATVESPGDGRPEDNEGGAVVLAVGRPRVLSVRPSPGRRVLDEVLTGQGFEVEPSTPGSLPPELGAFDAVILDDVPAAAFGDAFLADLAEYVGERGGGLLMTGDAASFGPGGYAGSPVEEVLPLDLSAPRRDDTPGLVLVLVLDKSGSMAGEEGGFSKLAAAKEAALSLLDVLGPNDSLGVVAFDEVPVPVMSPRRAADPEAVRRLFDRLEAGGGTKLAPALRQAYGWLEGFTAQSWHVLLLSDGQAEGEELKALEQRLAASDVVLSAVGVGPDVDRAVLGRLAEAAGGRVYFPDTLDELPDVFRREGRLISGEWRVERRFRPRPAEPHEILRGVDVSSMPEMDGYVASTAKAGASVLLVSDLQDPILAVWRDGLGKASAFTSASAWLGVEPLGKLWTQTVRWTARGLRSEILEPRLVVEGDRVRLLVDAYAEDGRFLSALTVRATVRFPDGTQREVPAAQTDAGRYEADLGAAGRGAYLVRVTASGDGVDESVLCGVYVSSLPEDRSLGANLDLLRQIAERTGGALLEVGESPFRSSGVAYRELWSWLSGAALFLFLFDVALRLR